MKAFPFKINYDQLIKAGFTNSVSYNLITDQNLCTARRTNHMIYNSLNILFWLNLLVNRRLIYGS